MGFPHDFTPEKSNDGNHVYLSPLQVHSFPDLASLLPKLIEKGPEILQLMKRKGGATKLPRLPAIQNICHVTV